MTLAFLSLGSNIAPERHLPAAVREIARLGALLALSRAYETPPVGGAPQPRFVNCAALLETDLDALALKAALRQIEERLGRVRQADQNAPRTIDLDIALFGDETLHLHGRQIPDPALQSQAHIAVPLADLSPAHRHPLTGQPLAQIAAATDQRGLLQRRDIDLWPTPAY